MKKLLIVLPSFAGGGAEKVGINYANELSNQGNNVTVLVFNNFGPLSKDLHSNIKCKILNKKIKYGLFEFLKFINMLRPDVIIGTIREVNIIITLSKFLNYEKKLIFLEPNTLHGLNYRSFFYKSLIIGLMRIFYNYADYIIANSYDTKKDLIEVIKLKNNNIKVIGNPVYSKKVEELSLASIQEEWFSDEYRVILGVGRLEIQKNFERMIEIFQKVNLKQTNTRLIILGSGSLYSKLKKLIYQNDLDSKCKIINYVNNPYPYFKNANLFFLTSKWEGFGNVIIDSLACKTQVLALSCPGGPKDILKDGKYGAIVDNENDDLIVETVINLINKKAYSDQLMKKRASEYSIEKIIQDATQLWR